MPIRAPIVAPAPVASPAPAPAPQRREVAAAVPSSAPAAPTLDAKTVEQIFSCLAPGLPAEWKRTWVVVSAGGAEAKFYYSNSLRGDEGEEFKSCNAQEISRRIVGLDAALPPAQLGWRSARLVIDNEGAYELKYDYGR